MSSTNASTADHRSTSALPGNARRPGLQSNQEIADTNLPDYFGKILLPESSSTPETTETTARPVTEDRSPLDHYMREVGEFSLLKPSEEGPLARAAQSGDDDARDRMITSNLRLVIKIARDYKEFGLPIEDLINEGNIGLMKAVDMFDPDRGVRFSSYASQWIKQYVRRALSNHARTIRLPLHMVDRVAKIHRLTNKYLQDHGREPTDQELATALELPVKKIAAAKRASQRARSLDRPVSEDSESSLGELVADESVVAPDASLDSSDVLQSLPDLMDQLPSRESIILQRRFGLDGQEPETLDKIGARLGVCRERVRQLQNEALGRLRDLIEAGAAA